MKIEKGTMILEKITNRYYELTETVETKSDLIAYILNMENKVENLLMSTLCDEKYYAIDDGEKFLISKNNTNSFISAYKKACTTLEEKMKNADGREGRAAVMRDAFYESAKKTITCLDLLDKTLVQTESLLAHWKM